MYENSAYENSASVLVIEDDSSLGPTLVEILKCAGFSAVLASTADQAHESMVEANDFDVLLLDLQLDHERGESLIESMRASGADIPPIVIYSAMPMAVTHGAFKQLGAAAVVSKNGNVAEVVSALRMAAQR